MNDSTVNNLRIQLRRMDIFGEEFLTYYEEDDWDYLMKNLDMFNCPDTRVMELWMLCCVDDTEERVCVWSGKERERPNV